MVRQDVPLTRLNSQVHLSCLLGRDPRHVVKKSLASLLENSVSEFRTQHHCAPRNTDRHLLNK